MATKPFEARRLPELPQSDELAIAFSNLLVAVNGFPYAGDGADTLALGLRWMRANPDQADILLGRS